MAQSSEATKLSSHNVDNKNSTLVNTVLTYLTLVGVGAIVGYVIFFSIYNHRCSDMMDDAERNFNQTKEGLSHKLIEAIHKNTANEVAESEVLELRGRLAGQADLLGKYQALLDNHQTTVERLNGLQTKVTELQSCPMRINDLENTLNVASVQKDSLEKRLQQANEKVEQLQEQSKNSVVAAACEAQQQKSMTHIQKLHQALCKENYGEGPYFVQFDLDIDDNEEGGNLFIVEVPTLDTLPNAVFTFLTLVNKNIYTGLEFLSMQSTIHLDSDERKVAELPYAGSALSLVESAASGICTPYSVGFVGANGALKIIMTSDVSKHGSLACFGRITQGRRTISQIQQAARRGNTVSVTDVKIIEMASRPSVSEGEL